jgi:6-phosphogluconolactonase
MEFGRLTEFEPMPPVTHDFADGDALAHALARAVASDLGRAIAARGAALLAASGGRTPLKFLRALAQQPLAWNKVIVTLVDERWVAPTHERSNAALVISNLLQGNAAAAQFVPLYEPGAADPETGLAAVSARIGRLALPFDAVVLGMGDDGHTASFFPHGDHLAAALDARSTVRVLPMGAPGAGEPRITLTLPVLVGAHSLYLHIEGTRKREVLHAAESDDSLPISTVLRHSSTPVQIYWCA